MIARAHHLLRIRPISAQRIRPEHATVLVRAALRAKREMDSNPTALDDDVAAELLGPLLGKVPLVVAVREWERVGDVAAANSEEVDAQAPVMVVPDGAVQLVCVEARV